MNKLKLFLSNFFIYGLGGIISKIIPLIMVPVVTRIMPDTSYYGLSDINTTIVSFGSALAIMGMYDAMYRMFFDREEEEYKRQVCSTALIFTLISSFVISALVILLKDVLVKYSFRDAKYTFLVYLTGVTIFVSATNGIISAPTRMQNRRKVFLVMNTVSPVLSYSVSIPLLLKEHYVIALPLAGFITGLSSELIFFMLNRKWFRPDHFVAKELLKMLKIGLPTVPCVIFYWVFNASDRIMISNILDTAATGIYAVGAKLGMASQLIYTAFAGGWQYFAFATMKEENQVKSNSMIFEYLGVISFVSASAIFVISRPFYEILFTGEYVKGYIVAPYLFLAPLLQMLYQVIGNQFLLVKNTLPSMFILMSGAALNIVLNIALIPCLGIEGAAISSLIGYTVSLIIAVIVLLRMKLMVISNRFLLASGAMTAYILAWRFWMTENVILSLLCAVFISIMMFMLYRRDVNILVQQLFGQIKERKKS